MKKMPYVYAGAVSAAVAAGLGLSAAISQADPPSKSKGIPVFQVNANWPQPLPVAGQFGSPPAISTADGQAQAVVDRRSRRDVRRFAGQRVHRDARQP